MNTTKRKPKGITLGMQVRYIRRDRPTGERVMGEGDPTAWLCVGAVGKVIELHEGYEKHRCPDHHRDPNCVCGGFETTNTPGWVNEMAPWATVEYETDRPGCTIKRAIESGDRGKTWERV